MEFKERFKGRTSNVTKVGVLDTLAISSNPVQKSQSNTKIPPYPSMPTTISNNPPIPSNNPRPLYEDPFENKPRLPLPAQHATSKSPAPNSNRNQDYPPRIPMGPNSNSAQKNPYFVNNPFSYDAQENVYGGGYDNDAQNYNRLEPKQVQQPMPVNQFNPNSFYNQHSQYKGGEIAALSPKKENIENYKVVNANQARKQNFENLIQQNKQKNLAEGALRGFESPQRSPHRPYEQQFDQMISNYSQPQFSVPNFGYNGYNGARDIHSNPSPNQQFEPNKFGQFQGNMTYQPDRRNQYEEQPKYSNQRQTKLDNSGYKPYSIKDYKDLKTKGAVKLGGLGPNTNTGEWYKQKEKREKMQGFSDNVKLFNAQRISNTENNFKPRREKEKEKSRREIALEFAKNVPKPKQKRHSPDDDDFDDEDLGVRKIESDKGPPINYMYDNNDLDQFEQKHTMYLAQLERMKMI